MSIANLRFVVTGGAEGIGASISAVAASQGAQVCIADLNDKGRRVADEIVGAGGKAWSLNCDVTDTLQLNHLMAAAAERMGGIDVLVNNAGVIDTVVASGAAVTLEDYDPRIWDKVIAINLTAPMFAAKAALPWLKQSGNASIINAGSTASFVAYASSIAYATSKGGVAMLTKSLANELAPFGIRCNAYCPGSINTAMNRQFIDNAPDPDAVRQHFYSLNMQARFGEPSEVAELVCFLASDKARYVNGVTWLIDGGSLAFR